MIGCNVLYCIVLYNVATNDETVTRLVVRYGVGGAEIQRIRYVSGRARDTVGYRAGVSGPHTLGYGGYGMYPALLEIRWIRI